MYPILRKNKSSEESMRTYSSSKSPQFCASPNQVIVFTIICWMCSFYLYKKFLLNSILDLFCIYRKTEIESCLELLIRIFNLDGGQNPFHCTYNPYNLIPILQLYSVSLYASIYYLKYQKQMLSPIRLLRNISLQVGQVLLSASLKANEVHNCMRVFVHCASIDFRIFHCHNFRPF